jgi:hypothetical protein
MPSTAPADGTPRTAPALPAPAAAPPSWQWRRAALLLAIAVQLITISALVRDVGIVPATWMALLLAIGPAPLALAAAFAPVPASGLAAAAGVLVLVTGIAGQITHTGVFFVPALVALTGGAVLLWRERPPLHTARGQR